MKKYLFQADFVRTFAILAVIGVHLVIPITARPDFFGGGLWWLTFLVNCLFRISVPLFILLSGYLTLGKSVTVRQNLSRVTRRLLVPLVAYYIIFTVVYASMAWLRAEPFDYWGIFHNLSKNTHSSLYFLVVLLFIQLLNPLWNLLTEEKNTLVLQYVCTFFFILGAVANIFYYLSLREGEVFSTYTYWLMWVGYYLYGYWVKRKPVLLSSAEKKWYSYLFIIGYIATVAFGYVTLWLFHHHVNELFYIGGQTYADGYLSISVMMMSVSVFNLLMRSEGILKLETYDWIKKPVVFLAGLAFAMYLNHLLVMDVLSKFFGITPDSPSMASLWMYLIIETITAFALTIPLAYLIQKTPVLKKIVGG
ncbi:MAG: acyltransferase family protein [Patescibacteria group bacterium]